MLFFGSHPVSLDSKKLTIQNDEGSYTVEFNMLLKDYYL
jgi:hypothetical protein